MTYLACNPATLHFIPIYPKSIKEVWVMGPN